MTEVVKDTLFYPGIDTNNDIVGEASNFTLQIINISSGTNVQNLGSGIFKELNNTGIYTVECKLNTIGTYMVIIKHPKSDNIGIKYNIVQEEIQPGLTGPQEIKINDILTNTADIGNQVWNSVNRSLTDIQTDIRYVNGIAVHSIDEFKALTEIANLDAKIDTIIVPSITEIRDEIIKVQFGGLEILNNQCIITDTDGVTIAIFNLFDKQGNPTTSGSVYKRTNV